MKHCKNIIWILCLLAAFTSCKKDELNVQNPLGLGGDSTAVTSIDKWILDSLTKTYNIDVRYRWDPANATIYKDVTPTEESKVIPLLSSIKKLWIGPYNDVTGSDLFMKKYVPKQIILLGSVEYDATGAATLASEASAGVINILDVNQHAFPDSLTAAIFRVHIIHHEFTHTLHDLVIYPQEFIGVSSRLGLANYTVTWYNITDAEALQQGYASAYAMDLPREDFAETASIMLTDGKNKWEEVKASANATARQALQQKEDIVVNYYKQTWNIDFYSLQTRVQAAFTSSYSFPLTGFYGYGKQYTTVSINPANTTLLTQQAGFTNAFNSAKTALLAQNATAKYTLDSLAMITSAVSSNTLRLYFHSGTTNYLGDYNYSFTTANGIYTFTYTGVPATTPGANGTGIKTSVQPLLNYFANNTFKIDWYVSPLNTTQPLRVVFTPQTTANAACMDCFCRKLVINKTKFLMINKFLSGFCILAVLLTGCAKKTESIFDKTVDERLSASLTSYQNALINAPGWKLFVYPKGLESQKIKVGGLTYYLKFDTANRVSMVSDFQASLASSPRQSSYRLKSLQRPSLIFDTYSYMHIPADPDASISLSPTGTNGSGWGTDFNFAFKDVAVKDTMVLEGNFNHSAAVLVKASQAEMDAAFRNNRLRDIINFSGNYPLTNPFLYFSASSSLKAGVGFDLTKYIISFTYVEGSNVTSKNIAYSYTTYGIHLMTPVTVGNYTFQDIYWDDAKKIYYILSGATHIEFANASAPLITLPLTNIIGSQFTYISVPPNASTPGGVTLPNESSLFLSRYAITSSSLISGPYGLKLDELDFVFDAIAKTMDVYVFLYQDPDPDPYLAVYYYSYTVDASGYYKFTKIAQSPIATQIQANMNNLLSYIGNDQFKLDGFSSSFAFMGQFTSRQTPAFYFTGYLY